MRRRIRKAAPATKAKSASSKKNPFAAQTERLIEQRVEADRFANALMRGRAEDVVNLKAEGMSHGQIAKALGITSIEVTEALVAGLEEYFAERDEAVRRYLAVANARYDRIFRTWMPLAEPRVVVTQGAMGERVEVFYPPDPEAARVVLTAMRDAARMMGLNKVRIEHTGKDGGKIEVDIDWTNLSDEQLEKFKSTNDVGVLRAFTSAASSASGTGDPSSQGETG